MNKKNITITIIVCSLILVGILGSYAFFINSVENNKNQEVTVETGTMALIFDDGNNGFNQGLNFGESAEKTFTIENTGTKDGVVSVSWMNLLNTYLEGSMTYSFLESNSEDGEYTEIISNKNVPVSEKAEDRVLASGVTIPAGTKKYYKLIIQLNYTDFDQTEDLQARMESQFKITEGVLKDISPSEKTLAKLGKKVKDGTPDFGNSATTDETSDGLYAMEDNYGMSYYYRGNVRDNYVRFAGYYWRIIRVNGDGSLRIIYDGFSAYSNEITTNRLALTDQSFNSAFDDVKNIGYMFSEENGAASTSKEEAQTNTISSDMKLAVENWYKSTIKDRGYDIYVSDNLFCNDRTIPGKETTLWVKDTGLGYGANATMFGAGSRFTTGNNTENIIKLENPIPKFTCKEKNDAFTKDDIENGNGTLGEKVGLITADEVVAAGSGKYMSSNSRYYLYKGVNYWTYSPKYFSGTNAIVYTVISSGALNSSGVNMNSGVAPVISLKAEFVSDMKGNGTSDSPFEIQY